MTFTESLNWVASIGFLGVFLYLLFNSIKGTITIIRATKIMHNVKIQIAMEGARYFDDFEEEEYEEYWVDIFPEDIEFPTDKKVAVLKMVEQSRKYCTAKNINWQEV